MDKYGIGDCFKDVEYIDNPLVFNSYSQYDIEWEIGKDRTLYKSLSEIEKDQKLMDELFLKMFTRLDKRYCEQNEQRIILGGRNIPNKNQGITGYKISIPLESIKRIYLHPNTPSNIIKELNQLNIEIKR